MLIIIYQSIWIIVRRLYIETIHARTVIKIIGNVFRINFTILSESFKMRLRWSVINTIGRLIL